MRQSILATCCLLLAACAPKSHCHDYSSPERAARSFLEAGRVGDTDSVRQAVIAAERDSVGHVDYQSIGEYSLTLDRLVDERNAIVTLQTGPIRSPLACIMESGAWKVTIKGTLSCMQEQLQEQLASAPR